MRLRRLIFGCLVPLALVAAGAAITLRQSALPISWNPLPDLELSEPDPWFVDWRLARLKSDAALCGRVLHTPWVEASTAPDAPFKDGCGWTNAVRLSEAGDARVHVNPITCELSAALALWLAHHVQPTAQKILGSKVISVQHLGGYACRNVKGSPQWTRVRSEHAKANALDVTGFTLANGRHVSVARHWPTDGPEARFLHAVHSSACRYFRVAIGPDYNAAHRDHFHYDRGFFSACK